MSRPFGGKNTGEWKRERLEKAASGMRAASTTIKRRATLVELRRAQREQRSRERAERWAQIVAQLVWPSPST